MNHAIILAAGKSTRFSKKQDKMLIEVAENPLIYYSLTAFNDHPDINSITVVCSKANKEKIKDIVKNSLFPKVKKFILGGKTRQESVEKGLASLRAKSKDIILVHNGANPLPSFEEITEIIQKSKKHGAAISGHFVSSTIKEVNDTHIIKTHDRTRLFAAETPQAAEYSLLKKGLKNAQKNKLKATDEAMLLEAIDHKVAFVEADKNNFKITTDSDLNKLRVVLCEKPKDFRVGFGQDSHMFEEKKKGLVLAGVEFKEELKLQADSDGDVILHAIFNAISQAIGDISLGFYANSLCKQGITDSNEYLKIILKKMKRKKFKINNLGIMVECKTPKVDPLTLKLKKSLSTLLDLPIPRIGITATTGEKSPYGEGLGIQCFAIVSLKKP